MRGLGSNGRGGFNTPFVPQCGSAGETRRLPRSAGERTERAMAGWEAECDSEPAARSPCRCLTEAAAWRRICSKARRADVSILSQLDRTSPLVLSSQEEGLPCQTRAGSWCPLNTTRRFAASSALTRKPGLRAPRPPNDLNAIKFLQQALSACAQRRQGNAQWWRGL